MSNHMDEEQGRVVIANIVRSINCPGQGASNLNVEEPLSRNPYFSRKLETLNPKPQTLNPKP